MVSRRLNHSKMYGMASAGSHHRRKLLSNGVKAVVLYSVVALAIGTVLVVRLRAGERELDESLCKRGGPPPPHVVVLVDPTDPLSSAEAPLVRRAILHRVETLKPGERLSVVTIKPQPQESVTDVIFSRCRPPDGSDANPLIENKRRLQKRYHEEFEASLTQTLTALETLPGAATSPLRTALREVATMRTFTPEAPRELIFISDLLEHTEGVSQYGHLHKAAARPLTGTLAELHGGLAGVDVLVLLRTSPQTCPFQTSNHAQFWQTTMQLAGVASYQVKQLYGCVEPSVPLPVRPVRSTVEHTPRRGPKNHRR